MKFFFAMFSSVLIVTIIIGESNARTLELELDNSKRDLIEEEIGNIPDDAKIYTYTKSPIYIYRIVSKDTRIEEKCIVLYCLNENSENCEESIIIRAGDVVAEGHVIDKMAAFKLHFCKRNNNEPCATVAVWVARDRPRLLVLDR